MAISTIQNASFGSDSIVNANGIKFPATQVASADANTLDDYEEGTWTPTVTGTGGASGVTYADQHATYTKIGRLVYVQVYVNITNKGTGSGSVRVDGLPFTSLGGTYYQAYQNEILGVSMPSDCNNMFTRINPSSSSISIEFYDTRASSTATGRGEVGYSYITNSFRLLAGLVYQTS